MENFGITGFEPSGSPTRVLTMLRIDMLMGENIFQGDHFNC
jgi:hypothetical protein